MSANLLVLSTGRAAPTKALCLASVRMQIGGPYQHLYIESPEDRTVTQNVFEAINGLLAHAKIDSDTVIVWLDGDDYLFHCNALVQVQRFYSMNPGLFLTYGQFVDSAGRPGFAAEYTTPHFRSAPWLATHLKTFKAGLFAKLTAEDLQHDGKWIPMAADQAVMLPLLELAGSGRFAFIRDPLVVYNVETSHWSKSDDAGRAEEQHWAQTIRLKPAKERAAL